MATEFVKIAKIGQKITSQSTAIAVRTHHNEFNYKSSVYKLLVEVDIIKVIKGL